MSTNTQYKIAIIGPSDTVSGFRALGVVTFSANNSTDALEQIQVIKEINADNSNADNYAVICIMENLLTDVDQAEYAKLTQGALPAVVVLPGPEGAQGFALNRLRQLAEQAVGSAII